MRHFKIILNLFLLGFFSFLVSCSSNNINSMQKTVPYVDLKRYQGTWHEIARLPMFGEKKCVSDITANYKLRNNRVEVVNKCKQKDGKYKSATAYAFVKDHTTNSKLTVSFVPFFKRWGWLGGDYWIIALDDENYNWAMVGNPNLKYLWILARDKHLKMTIYNKLVNQAKLTGYNTNNLIISDHQKP